MSDSLPKVDPLIISNWHTWETHVHAWHQYKGYWDVVSGETEEPDVLEVRAAVSAVPAVAAHGTRAATPAVAADAAIPAVTAERVKERAKEIMEWNNIDSERRLERQLGVWTLSGSGQMDGMMLTRQLAVWTLMGQVEAQTW
jgi:hypothetical protein